MPRKIKIGDRIRFQAATRWNCGAVTRKVTGLDHFGRPCVVYGGWSDFVVRWNEILEVFPA